MKKFFFLVVSLISIYSNSLTAQNPNSINNQITDYYYYQGQSYHLNLNPGSIFIKFSEPLTKAGFIELTDEYRSLFSFDNFNENEKMQIVDLTLPISTNDRLNDLINILKLKPGVEYASPVFKMPSGEGNPEVRVGFLNEIIVQFKENMNEAEVSDFISSRSMQKIQKFDITGGICYLMRISNSLSAMDIANEIYLSGFVKSSEPNFFCTNISTYMPNDTFVTSQWSVENTGSNVPGFSSTPGCDMRVDSAWNITLGSNKVLVSVVDSGIDTLHEDMADNIVPGSAYDFYNDHPGGYDDMGHGTCVAGIIGAIGNNDKGVTGISPLSKMVSVKILQANNSTNAGIINGMLYSWQHGQSISNNSWGGIPPISAVNQAITDGRTYGRNGKGTVFIFGTGNTNAEGVIWPASHPDVISVGGINPCNQRKYPTATCGGGTTWGATYGPGLDIVAPCVRIYTTDISGSSGYYGNDYFPLFAGTSSACPNVSGVCALMLSVDSTLRWDSVRAIINRTAEKVGNYTYDQPGPLGTSGWNNEMGYGKVNSYRALLDAVKSSVNPIINVKGIPYGSNTPDSVNNTDYGNVSNGSSKVNTFTIQNLGTPNLNVTSISITGPNAGLFTAGALTPASSISSGDSASFTVTFTPLSIGLKTATITIANNDPKKSSYTFTISGTGISGGQSPGAALSFEGNLDCVALPNSLTTAVSNNTEISVEYWFKGSSLQSAVRFQPNGNNYIVAGWNGLHIISTDGMTSGISVGANATNGNWHHIAMTWKKNTVNGFKSYLDGVLVEQRNSSNVNLPAMTFGGYLGSFLASSDYLNGTLDEVRIWNRALSQSEIQFNMNCEIPVSSLGLMANYHFNQGIGGSPNPGVTTLNDASGNGYNGSLLNFNLSGQISNWTSAGAVISGYSCPNPGAALKFDGINDFVSLPNSLTAAATGNMAITIEYWFKGTNLNSGVRFQSTTSNQNFIIAGYNGTHYLSIEALALDAGAAAEDGKWHHIAMTWEKNTVNGFKSYLDGSIVAQRNSANVNLPDITTGGCLGSYSGNSEFMNGTLDEVRIWNRALSQAEIQSNMNCEIPAGSSGLLANYHFNQGISESGNTGITTLTDASGNGYNGTLNNFNLSGAASNWIGPGGVTSYISCGTSMVNIKVIPQGFYNSRTDKLNRRDTVWAYLHSDVSPFNVLDSAISVIDSVSYKGVFSFKRAGAGNYYIRINLKNTINTWSRTGGFIFIPGSEMNYDFTSHPTQALGNNVNQVDSSPLKFGIYSGDVNFDDVIDLNDVNSVYADANIFTTGYKVTDVTGDNLVDLYDLTLSFNNSRGFVSTVTP